MRAGGKIKWPVYAILCFVPLSALADAGTPLMWAGMLHLVFGNALIGIGEGMLLAFLFHLKRWKCILAMIAANYFSAWVGDVFVLGYALKSPEPDLYQAWRWVWIMIAVTFIVSCIPFAFWVVLVSQWEITLHPNACRETVPVRMPRECHPLFHFDHGR